MLEVTVIPDSPMAEIFGGKCCGGGLPDQNLEILIRNYGPTPIEIQSRFRLEDGDEPLLCEAVCPVGGRSIAPGEVAALYAGLDPVILTRYRSLVLFDHQGRSHRVPIGPDRDQQSPGENNHDHVPEP
jgi:hypothetical protein